MNNRPLHAERSLAALALLLGAIVLALLAPPAGGTESGTLWQWPSGSPVPVVSSFAPPAHDWLPGRRGVTLSYPSGSPVYACANGTVTFAGQVGGRQVVSLRHDVRGRAVWSTYLPVTPSVSAGQAVTAGQVIGVVEEGSDTLHWGAKTGPTAYMDPIRLTVGRPRLLPWDG
jgi:hypothetical protein